MTFIYPLIFLFAFFEFVFIFLFFLPFGKNYHRQIFYLIDGILKRYRGIFFIILFFVFIIFINSLLTVMKSSDHNTVNPQMPIGSFNNCKLFYEQRNLYLTFITLLMGYIIDRIPNTFKQFQIHHP